MVVLHTDSHNSINYQTRIYLFIIGLECRASKQKSLRRITNKLEVIAKWDGSALELQKKMIEVFAGTEQPSLQLIKPGNITCIYFYVPLLTQFMFLF